MPNRFKETGYVSTRQDAIKPYYPDIEYKRFNDINKIYLDKRDEIPDSYEVFTPKPRRFIGKDGNVYTEKYNTIVRGVPANIVSPEFDAVMVGRALINGFSKQLPRIMLKKKNNKLPFNIKTQTRFGNMYNAAKVEAANNAVEQAANSIYDDIFK